MLGFGLAWVAINLGIVIPRNQDRICSFAAFGYLCDCQQVARIHSAIDGCACCQVDGYARCVAFTDGDLQATG
ncbi:hypothetical protein D3C86_2095780 [compost metagenome]